MYKIIASCFLAFLAIFGLSACNNDNKLTMATAAEFPPFEYKEGEAFKGIDIEIAQEIAKRLGKTLEIKDMEFDSVVSAISSGNADFGASGLTINENRSKVINFSNSYYNAAQVVIIKEDNEKLKAVGKDAKALFEAIDAQKGIKIGVATGTTGSFYANGDKDWGFIGFKNAEVKNFVNGSLAVSALMNNQVEIVILDEAPANILSKANAGTQVLEAFLTEEKYGIGVNKNNTALLEDINKALDSMKQDGTLDTIIKKYF
ncbi:arginine-binding protein [Helicobacter valdiviensis]|uniref:Arginine-binding protein n=1 Tax=Helicobacter valdiviensis TaxID=1458358 RepID=A0A2W6MYN2_9HELI|nr:ABC transporter substrate-binding protein [Helicobacter valdiviensis]PZT48408.1 arginine-binding protein [Helicobacter valdiviensis]